MIASWLSKHNCASLRASLLERSGERRGQAGRACGLLQQVAGHKSVHAKCDSASG